MLDEEILKPAPAPVTLPAAMVPLLLIPPVIVELAMVRPLTLKPKIVPALLMPPTIDPLLTENAVLAALIYPAVEIPLI